MSGTRVLLFSLVFVFSSVLLSAEPLDIISEEPSVNSELTQAIDSLETIYSSVTELQRSNEKLLNLLTASQLDLTSLNQQLLASKKDTQTLNELLLKIQARRLALLDNWKASLELSKKYKKSSDENRMVWMIGIPAGVFVGGTLGLIYYGVCKR